jgi:hypothetical protein
MQRLWDIAQLHHLGHVERSAVLPPRFTRSVFDITLSYLNNF